MIINLSGTALADGQPVSEPVELVFCLDVQLAIVGQQRRQRGGVGGGGGYDRDPGVAERLLNMRAAGFA